MLFRNILIMFGGMLISTSSSFAFGEQEFAICHSAPEKITTQSKLDCGDIGNFSLKELGKRKWEIVYIQPGNAGVGLSIFFKKIEFSGLPPVPPVPIKSQK